MKTISKSILLFIFVAIGHIYGHAQITTLGDTPCDAPEKTVANAPCRTATQTRYEANFTTNTFIDYLPNQATCTSAEEPYDGWLSFVATSEATAVTWQDLSSNNHALYFYKEVNNDNCPTTEPELDFLFCRDREYLTNIRYEWMTFSTQLGERYYIRIKKVIEGSNGTGKIDGRLCLMNPSVNSLCGDCSTASCSIDGPYDDLTAALNYNFSTDCQSQNSASCNIACDTDGPQIIQTCHQITASKDGTFGIVRYIAANASCLDPPATNNISNSIGAELYTNGSCATPMYPTATPSYSQEDFFAEWQGLSPNTAYTICLYQTIPASQCSFEFQCPRFYYPASTLPLANSCRSRDSLALVALYESTNGPNWINTWDLTQPINTWFGVGLNQEGCVSCLALNETGNCAFDYFNYAGNNLSGNLPNLSLSNLDFLQLSGNSLTGTIPNFDNLPNLKNMQLGGNQFSGAIPDFNNCPKLEGISLEDCGISGNIPVFTNLTELKTLYLYFNNLTGTIPDFSPNSKLTDLQLHQNQLSGPIPASLGALANISRIVLFQNQLAGCFPSELLTQCDKNIDFNNNVLLPWQGDFSRFCNGEEQIGATCDDGDTNTTGEVITSDCECKIEDCTNTTDNHPDYDALIALYTSTNGDNWTNNAGWKEGAIGTSCDPCDFNGSPWFGIQCKFNRVSVISLCNSCSESDRTGNNLVGILPEEIGTISELEFLTITNNKQLTGEIPSSITNLTKLVRLILGDNNLSGSIPNDINKLSNLSWLFLYDNQLEGNIPESITDLTNLAWLNFPNNKLTGSIPISIDRLENLERLYLSNNNLDGPLPPTLGNLSKLINVSLYENNFSGCFPSSYQALCTIDNFNSSANPLLTWQGSFSRFCNGETQIDAPCQLNGQDAIINENCECILQAETCRSRDSLALVALYESTDGPNWTNTWDLNQSMNLWYGVTLNTEGCVICLDLDGVPDCQRSLFVEGNNLTGSLPDLELENLQNLFLGYNNLNGTIPDFNKLIAVENIWLTNNNLSGTVVDFSNLPNLRELDLGSNNLTGAIPNFSNLPKLEQLWLYGNQLTGNIPNFNQTPLLEILSIYANNLSGSIPNLNLPNLERLDIRINNLTSTIPELDLPKLHHFFANDNMLTGNLPDFIGAMDPSGLFLQNNNLSGCFPSSYLALCDKNLDRIDFSNNTLLAWQGDFSRFCNGEEQIGATCDDGDSNTIGEVITANCECALQEETCRSRDSLALVALYNATNGPNWTIPWDFSQSIDTWFGVTLNEEDCVECLDLDGTPGCRGAKNNGNNLSGQLPATIADLQDLKKLHLGENNLSGAIPAEIGDLLKLEDLVIDNNALSGTLPTSICNLTNLSQLVVRGNNLSGEIPNCIENLTALTVFYLGNNNFSGSVPAVTFPNLLLLDIADNNFSGTFPNSIISPSLLEIFIRNNNFIGELPSALGTTNVNGAFFNNNNFSGCFPAAYTSLCANDRVDFSGNALLAWEGDFARFCNGEEQVGAVCNDGDANTTGEVITSNCECKVEDCNNTADNHPDYDALIALYTATGGENWTNNTGWKEGAAGTSCDPCDFNGETWFGITCVDKRVTIVDLDGELDIGSPNGGNNLTGFIPVQIGTLSELNILSLGENAISGNIPSEIGLLINLEVLSLASNQLSGIIPTEIQNCSALHTLILNENNLSGSIPREIGQLKKLGNLQLIDNNLSGAIPEEIGLLSKLHRLILSNNQLTNTIPKGIGSLQNLVDFKVRNNDLSGCFPSDILQICYLYNEERRNCSWNNGNIEGCQFDFRDNPKLTWQGDFSRFCDGEQQIGAPCQLNGQDAIINENCECVLQEETCRSRDSLVLVEFYQTANGPDWNDTWDLRLSMETWNGITLSPDGCVEEIWINQPNNVSGQLLDFDLPELKKLIITKNELSGQIPNFSMMPKLEDLILLSNDLEEAIPDFSNLPLLKTLTLGGNNLGGQLPNFTNLPNLEFFNSVGNSHVGMLPAFENTNLKDIQLWFNDLSGPLPEEWRNLPLERLYVFSNNLSGSLPDYIFQSSSLSKVQLHSNNFSGCFQTSNNLCSIGFSSTNDSIGYNFTNNPLLPWQGELERFCNGEEQTGAPCQLNGQEAIINENCECVIQEENCRSRDSLVLVALYEATDGPNWTNTWDLNQPIVTWYGVRINNEGCVSCLDLDGGEVICLGEFGGGNNLNGRIVEEISNLTSLENLYLNENNFSGSAIPTSIGNLSILKHLHIINTGLEGNIPTSIGELSNLISLQLHYNNLSNPIPPEVGKLTNLEELILLDNNLTGTIPQVLTQLSNLRLLWLHKNQLEGNVPSDFGMLPNLEQLYLNNNLLSGTLPDDLGVGSSLVKLSLSNNNLNGCLPTSFEKWCMYTEQSQLQSDVFSENGYSFSNNPMLSWQGDFSAFCNGQEQIGAPCQLNGQDAIINENCECVLQEETCRSRDSLALTALYESTDGPNWRIPWDIDQSISNWNGVELNNEGCVTKLLLSENRLTGVLPPELGNLSELTEINFYFNQLTGNIPTELGNLQNLTKLFLNSNQLSGSIPLELGNLSNLVELSLSFNQLTGSIPSELGNLNNLSTLFILGNELTGNIPPELGNLSNLTRLRLNENSLSGCFPTELSNLCTIDYDFSDNPDLPGGGDFSSFCSNQVGACEENCRTRDSLVLVDIYSATNGTDWQIPWNLSQPMDNWFGVTLNSEGCVTEVKLCNPCSFPEVITNGGNGLVGQIPASIGNLKQLNALDLSGNNLSGAIPTSIGQLEQLIFLSTGYTNLSGSIPTSIGQLPILNFVSFDNNNLSGPIPDFISPELEYLILSNNNLTGSIPNIESSKLKSLYVPDNELTGTVPAFNSQQLEYVWIQRNSLSGSIPPSFAGLAKLIEFRADNNELTGIIPNFSSKSLEFLELAHNSLSGELPVFDLPNLKMFWLTANNVSGNLSASINLPNIETFWISGNQLSGEVPSSWSHMVKMKNFSLDGNSLSGPFPSFIKNFPDLIQIWLNDNDFEGCFEDMPNICNISATETGYNFKGNPKLPWEGDYERYCNGEDQFGSICNDGNFDTIGEVITSNCMCEIEETALDCPSITSDLEATICEGETYQLGNQALESAGSYSETFTSFQGCDSTINLTLVVEGVATFGAADAGSDQVTCSDQLSLTGNLPPNTTGRWINESVAALQNENSAVTQIRNLQEGESIVTWSLSSENCPDYDQATIRITKNIAPVAIPDTIQFNYSSDPEFTLLSNDIIPQSSNWSLELVSDPPNGVIENMGDGKISFAPFGGYYGTTYFQYQLCSTACDDCSTAEVMVIVGKPTEEPKFFFVPSGFTPDGDGKNDEFIVPELLDDPDKYPEAELIIFNRWGQIVFQAQPYQNDWDGTSQKSGKPLPAGTYYYIVRLDVADGMIRRGEVTLFR